MLVTFDALRADRLGAYGYGKRTSPALDAFSRDAVLFTDALAQSGSTPVSLPSIFTAKYPIDGILEAAQWSPLRPGETTLAEVLKSQGYRTVAVVAHDYAGSRHGLAQGFDVFDEALTAPEPPEATERRILRNVRGLRPPFFLWVHVRQPHTPFAPPPSIFRELYDGPPHMPTIFESGFEAVLQATHTREPVETFVFAGRDQPLTPTMVEQLRSMYDANIRVADRLFERLLEALGPLDRIVLCVAADHGESLGEHRRIDHNTLQYAVLHTPLFFKAPGLRPSVSTDPAMNVDIAPTLLGRLGLGLELPAPTRGIDLLAERRRDEGQYAELGGEHTIKLGWLKLLLGDPVAAHRPRLYDLQNDPREDRDISGDRPEAVARLQALDAKIRSRSAIPTAGATDSRRALEELRALGYAR